MGYALKQGQTARPVLFDLEKDDGSGDPLTGASPTVTLSKNGAAYASPAGAVTEVGSGTYKIAGNATDSNTLGPLKLYATATGAYDCKDTFEVVAYDPANADSLGLAYLTAEVVLAAAGLDGIDCDGLNPRQALAVLLANLAGELDGAGTGTRRFYSVEDGSTGRIEMACAEGNRTSVTITPPA